MLLGGIDVERDDGLGSVGNCSESQEEGEGEEAHGGRAEFGRRRSELRKRAPRGADEEGLGEEECWIDAEMVMVMVEKLRVEIFSEIFLPLIFLPQTGME
ncbi:hypothetical protein BGE01nite_54150 [Brevifollis gellanilyticus]|uniref:Uncharacterized protein n=1 Tax=Brevifollis gellanilyticus TaxID=748831 RepID=A0A512MHC7_9BACT|nr:hypothetical protein BGE01nite_54150 [Brevifollis gellanilyticus]